MRRMTSQEKLYAMRFGGIMMIAAVVLLNVVTGSPEKRGFVIIFSSAKAIG